METERQKKQNRHKYIESRNEEKIQKSLQIGKRKCLKVVHFLIAMFNDSGGENSRIHIVFTNCENTMQEML